MSIDISGRFLEDFGKIEKIQKLQAGFTNVAFLKYPFLQWMSVVGIFLLAKTVVMRHFQHRIMLMEKPLPVDLKI